MKDVQCYELFGGIALKNHAFSFHFHKEAVNFIEECSMKPYSFNLDDMSDGGELRKILKKCVKIVLLKCNLGAKLWNSIGVLLWLCFQHFLILQYGSFFYILSLCYFYDTFENLLVIVQFC